MSRRQQDAATIQKWIEAVEMHGKGLTAWEHDFMQNVRDRFDRVGWLTTGQEESLERIYAEKTP